jgi:hypothetical protein
MLKRANLGLMIVAIAILVAIWAMAGNALAQTEAAVPKPQDKLALGEEEVKQLLLLIDTEKSGKISKAEYMKFLEAEFDRLDKDKSGDSGREGVNAIKVASESLQRGPVELGLQTDGKQFREKSRAEQLDLRSLEIADRDLEPVSRERHSLRTVETRVSDAYGCSQRAFDRGFESHSYGAGGSGVKSGAASVVFDEICCVRTRKRDAGDGQRLRANVG